MFDTGSVPSVQVTPSVDVAADVPGPPAIAQNVVPLLVMLYQFPDTGIVVAVQVIPLLDTAAVVPELARAQNTTPFHAIDCQKLADGNVPVVQLIPSVEVRAKEVTVPPPKIQNFIPFHSICDQASAATGSALSVQVIVSAESATWLDD